ncbi:MAG: SUMF1/EgtB/PvdO family nonheme iron enzyme [Deltaproteobacteria bacterium]|nr:SUMF1/EgtB/PvdO family nonheme iron enzyme [Deltaproteobacteria bacterium]
MSGRITMTMGWSVAAAAVCVCSLGCAQVIGLDKDYHKDTDAAAPGAGCLLTAPDITCSPMSGTTEMSAVPGRYCIDNQEVSWQQYLEWVATNPDTKDLPQACKEWKTDFKPGGDPPMGLDAGGGNYPVVFVDWCDAYMYCLKHNKRLCGKILGTAVPKGQVSTCGVDQWYTACSAGGKTAWSYGSEFKSKTCNAVNTGNPHVTEVSLPEACVSDVPAYQNLVNMSGNVEEWEDACETESQGAKDICYTRGGSFNDQSEEHSRCDAAHTMERGARHDFVGFRCCGQ